MDPARAKAFPGGLAAADFMRRHWQKRPLLVRAALVDAMPGFAPGRLFALAAEEGVESRLVERSDDGWSVRSGPIARRALPPLKRPGWSLLVQGVDLHDEAAHALLARFRFIADARLDDVMVSFASDGGGVGPHIDSYDVFLLQLSGLRRWQIGRVDKPRWRPDVPLKMLAGFEPRHSFLLGPGDMLYLPPGWGHDGVAEGPCLTASIGFRAPDAAGLGAELAQRLADAAADAADRANEVAGADAGARARRKRLYLDRTETATAHPARVPKALQRFADEAVERLLGDPRERARALGEVLSEPKPGTWFDRPEAATPAGAIRLDRRTRMLYDDRHVFINGESFRAGGTDGKLMRRLADRRRLEAAQTGRLSNEARALLGQWIEAGWCRAAAEPSEDESR